MGIIATIVIGFIVGLVAKMLMPGRDPGGYVITTLLGIAGAFVANYLGSAMGFYRPNEAAGFIASIIGAMVLLGIYRLAIGRRHLPS